MGDSPDPRAERQLEALLGQLDRLEDLLDDMDELGIDDRAGIEARMAELNAEIDRLTGE